MWSYCQTAGCDFVLGLGDNFYDNGVTGTDDEQWNTKFQEPFTGWDIPLYMTLGNHDYGGNTQAQIDYGKIDPRWRMPAAYYDFVEPPAHFIGVDTWDLESQTSETQTTWLEGKVKHSLQPWRILFGHYPWRSHGAHGEASAALRRIWEWTLCNRVDLLLSGHEHDMQLLVPECGVDLVISGSSVRQRNTTFVAGHSLFANSNPGFAWLEVSESRLLVKFVDLEGRSLFEYEREPRDRSPVCNADGYCNQDCLDDADCSGLNCSSDGSCESRCSDDPDCFDNCPCDQTLGICELRELGSDERCGCDPMCREG